MEAVDASQFGVAFGTNAPPRAGSRTQPPHHVWHRAYQTSTKWESYRGDSKKGLDCLKENVNSALVLLQAEPLLHMATLDLEGCTAAGIQDIYGDISSDLDYLIYVNDIMVDWILPCLRGDLASRFQREKSRQRIVLGAWFKQMGALFLQTTRHDITQASQALRDQRIRTADDFPVYRSSITAAVDTLRIEGAYSATLVIAQLVDGLPSKLRDVIANLYQPSWDLGKFFEVVTANLHKLTPAGIKGVCPVQCNVCGQGDCHRGIQPIEVHTRTWIEARRRNKTEQDRRREVERPRSRRKMVPIQGDRSHL